jgi:uncharacterized short protein YbdD (DUF466 family)
MKLWKVVWEILKALAGEGDYARYCTHMRMRHPDRRLPTEREFFLQRLEEKYSRPSRCC